MLLQWCFTSIIIIEHTRGKVVIYTTLIRAARRIENVKYIFVKRKTW